MELITKLVGSLGSIESILATYGLAYVCTFRFMLSRRIKYALFGPFAKIKVLDCLPCFAFWLSLSISFNIFTSILIFLHVSINKDK
jgi:hypothetical protein